MATKDEVITAVDRRLQQQKADYDKVLAALRERDTQALESQRLLHEARRTAEEREAYAKTLESAALERENKLAAEAERRHAEALATLEARLTQSRKAEQANRTSPVCTECPGKDHKISGLESTIAGLRELARTYEGDAKRLQQALTTINERDLAVTGLQAQLEASRKETAACPGTLSEDSHSARAGQKNPRRIARGRQNRQG